MKREYHLAVSLSGSAVGPFKLALAEYIVTGFPTDMSKYDKRAKLIDGPGVVDSHPTVNGFDRAHILVWNNEGGKSWFVSRPIT